MSIGVMMLVSLYNYTITTHLVPRPPRSETLRKVRVIYLQTLELIAGNSMLNLEPTCSLVY